MPRASSLLLLLLLGVTASGYGGPDHGHFNLTRHKRAPLFLGKKIPIVNTVGVHIGGRPVLQANVMVPILPGRVVLPGAVMVTPGYGQVMAPLPVPGQLPQVYPLMVKLRLSSRLRDNLVTVFGYILFRPTMVLDVQLYVSLFDLYNGARLRRIRTPELLYSLKQMSFSTPQQQFLLLMTELSGIVPRYLLGACSMWLDALRNSKVNMNDILRPEGGPLQADFLANIDFKLLDILTKPSQFTQSSQNFQSKIALDSMGRFFNNILGALNDGSLALSQGIIAGLMLHMQLQKFMPEVDEAQKYIADILDQERPELSFSIANVPQSDKRDPYSLVRFVLGQIANPPQGQTIDPNIQEAAQTILPYLRPPTFLTYNPDHERLSPIVSPSDINYELLFMVISPGEFPDDIIKARDLILRAIKRKEINMKLITTGFARYDYNNPRDLLIALLDRIKRRVFLPRSLSEPLLALILHLKFKLATIKLEQPHIADGMLEVNMLFMSFYTPATPVGVRELAEKVWKILSEEHIPWDKILRDASEYHARPRQKLIAILLKIISEQRTRNMELVDDIESLIEKLDEDGDPKSCPVMVCPPSDGLGRASRPVEVSTTTTTTPEPPPVNEDVETPTNISNVNIDKVISIIPVPPDEEENLGKIKTFIFEPKVMAIIGSIDVTRYPTQGLLLQAIFQALLKSGEVKYNNQEIYQLLQVYYKEIKLEGYGAQKWSSVTRTVDLNAVFQALDMQKMYNNGHGDVVQRLSDFLQGASNFNVNCVKVNDMLHLNKGQFLKEFFKRILEDSSVSSSAKEDINVCLNYIVTDGAGGEPVPYTEVTLS